MIIIKLLKFELHKMSVMKVLMSMTNFQDYMSQEKIVNLLLDSIIFALIVQLIAVHIVMP